MPSRSTGRRSGRSTSSAGSSGTPCRTRRDRRLAPMSPRLALTIGAVVAVLAGLGFTLAPAQLLLRFGGATPTEAILVTRDLGVTLVGLGVLNWLARDVTGPAVRAI